MKHLIWFLCALPALAHIGSPDIFLEGEAGPYPLFVTIRPPAVIPGVAEVEIRVREAGVDSVQIVPVPMTGAGAKFAPTADVAIRAKEDPQFFTGALWMMTSGAWQVRVKVQGQRGEGLFVAPVPALASRTESMQTGLGLILGALGLLLSLGAVGLVGAASREASLEPGEEPHPAARARARVAMGIAAAAVAAILYFGNAWWAEEAANYSRIVYRPLQMDASLAPGETLRLDLSDPGWLPRGVDDFVPDHGHLMHLYVVRLPELERVWHLHPEMTGSGRFTHSLPPMPAGRYALYADIVHESGLPETLSAEIELPAIVGKPLAGDDSAGVGPAFGQALRDRFDLPGGGRIVLEREEEPYVVKRAYGFRFRVEDGAGAPASGMELYMGMAGHAAFMNGDRTVFAHIHPNGSAPMASLALARQSAGIEDPHAGHAMHAGVLPAQVSFPYGFPQPGQYRILVQIKRNGQVQMGFFDVSVREPARPEARR